MDSIYNSFDWSGHNCNIVKIVDFNKRILYLSRYDIPFDFSCEDRVIKKHLSIIAFTNRTLQKFCDFNKSINENTESVELLRALDNNMILKTVKLNGESRAVDTLEDLLFVRKQMKKDFYFKLYIK